MRRPCVYKPAPCVPCGAFTYHCLLSKDLAKTHITSDFRFSTYTLMNRRLVLMHLSMCIPMLTQVILTKKMYVRFPLFHEILLSESHPKISIFLPFLLLELCQKYMWLSESYVWSVRPLSESHRLHTGLHDTLWQVHNNWTLLCM